MKAALLFLAALALLLGYLRHVSKDLDNPDYLNEATDRNEYKEKSK